jgi:ArsR family transcriptional regulator
MDQIYQLQADVLKALASPRRVEIVHRLGEGPREVGILAAEIGIAQPNLSQHLAVMRSAGIVEAERDGREVRYRLSDADVVVACNLMRAVLQRRLLRMSDLADWSGEPDGPRRAGSSPSQPSEGI